MASINKAKLDKLQMSFLNEMLRVTFEENPQSDSKETSSFNTQKKLTKSGSGKNNKEIINEYLASIGDFEELNEDEEKQLISQISNGEATKTKKLIHSNLSLVAEIVKEYDLPDEITLDLLIEGNNTLKEAAKNYKHCNPGHKERFKDYARKEIYQTITKNLNYLQKCFKVSCLACFLLSSFAHAGDLQAQKQNNKTEITNLKPQFISSSEWKELSGNIKKINKEYSLQEDTVIDLIKEETMITNNNSIDNSNQSFRNKLATKLNTTLVRLEGKIEASLTKNKDNSSPNKIQKSIDASLNQQLPLGSKWKAKIPKFLQKMEDNSQITEIKFPNGIKSKSGFVVAQVWINEGETQNMYAIPIQIDSYGQIEDTTIALAE